MGWWVWLIVFERCRAFHLCLSLLLGPWRTSAAPATKFERGKGAQLPRDVGDAPAPLAAAAGQRACYLTTRKEAVCVSVCMWSSPCSREEVEKLCGSLLVALRGRYMRWRDFSETMYPIESWGLPSQSKIYLVREKYITKTGSKLEEHK